MKRKLISWLMALAVLSATPCLASGKDKQDSIALDKIKARVVKAQTKTSRVTVKLKNGETIKGQVEDVTEQGFTIRGQGATGAAFTMTVDYSSVAAVKGQSAWSRAFKNIGEYSLLGAVGVALLPLYGVLALTGRMPSC
jgi:hypothetical protein